MPRAQLLARHLDDRLVEVRTLVGPEILAATQHQCHGHPLSEVQVIQFKCHFQCPTKLNPASALSFTTPFTTNAQNGIVLLKRPKERFREMVI
ncbi:hypothetical protein CCB81_09225 [Armatimonadetes bacterium Uphvl-Ar2]|nr:hypothetical protein CCB81_09225 [Armatimonadetes bacterium Uphvl-Ar2]